MWVRFATVFFLALWSSLLFANSNSVLLSGLIGPSYENQVEEGIIDSWSAFFGAELAYSIRDVVHFGLLYNSNQFGLSTGGARH